MIIPAAEQMGLCAELTAEFILVNAHFSPVGLFLQKKPFNMEAIQRRTR